MSNVTIQVDNFDDFEEAVYLFENHWKETEIDTEDVPVSVWKDAYKEMYDNGVLHIVTVRDNGNIVGYHVSSVQPHLNHSDTLMGFTLSFYLRPDYRLSGTGMKLLKFVEKTLEEKGVIKFYLTTKKKLDLGKLFEMLGYRPDEVTYSKMLGA